MKKYFVGGGLVVMLIALVSFNAALKKVRKPSVRTLHPNLTGSPYIIVDKSDYELQVYDDEGWYATYPVVFGSKNLDDKMVEGDRKTPEGVYSIIRKRPHEKWYKMMTLDYPTKTDIDKFNQRKAQGLIPKKAKIGGGIAIHGTWPKDEMVVDYFQNWTNGCVALKNEEMEDLFNLVPIGTKVTIRR
jgi:murein L,D-transpeptidase YafK